jgi:lysozyme family protein
MSEPSFPAPFVHALAFVLAREGGYADDPTDPGGETNYGITQGTYSAYYASRGLAPPAHTVRDIPMDDVVAIYWRNYWQDGHCAQFAAARPRLALAHFDGAVNMGIIQAARCLQRALGVIVDGAIGPDTLRAIETADEPATIERLLVERARVYREIVAHRPASRRFLSGWLARLRWVARACAVPITEPLTGAT